MIYTVTFNPSIDYIVSVNQLEFGKVNRTTSEMMLPGGKGINVSQVLQNLGIDSIALGFVAGFTGNQLIHMLQNRGIKTDFIGIVEGMTRINVKLHSNSGEGTVFEEIEINGQGPSVSEIELEMLRNQIGTLREDDLLVLSGSTPKSISTSIYAEILKLTNERGVKTIVDASGVLLWNALEYKPFLIKPNHQELGEIFNREIQEREEVIYYAKELQNRGAQNVLVSMGDKGAVLVAEDGKIYEEDAPQGSVKNTVGAGDSMVAGFLVGYLESDGDYMKALRMGIAAGSASAFSQELATREEVLKLCKSMDSKN